MNLSLCHEQSASLSRENEPFYLVGKRLIPVTYSLQQIPGISDFRSTVPVKGSFGFPAFPAFFQKINRRFKNQVKAGFNIDSAQALISFSEGESSSTNVLSFVVRLVISKNSFLFKVLYLATCGGRLIVLPCLPGTGQMASEKPAPFRVRA